MDCEVCIHDGMSLTDATHALIWYMKLLPDDEAAVGECIGRVLRRRGVRTVKALRLMVERDEPRAVALMKEVSAKHGRKLFVQLRYLLRRGASNDSYQQWVGEKRARHARAAVAESNAAVAADLAQHAASVEKARKAALAKEAHERFCKTHRVVPVCAATPKTPKTLKGRPAFDNSLWTPEMTVEDAYPYVI